MKTWMKTVTETAFPKRNLGKVNMLKKAAVFMVIALLSAGGMSVQAAGQNDSAKTESMLLAESGEEDGANLEGTLGKKGNLKWSYDSETQTLTVSGEDELNCKYVSYLPMSSPFQVQEKIKIEKIVFEDCKITGGGTLFAGLSSLQEIDFSGLDTSAVTDMERMFSGCSKLTSVNLSGLDTSAVKSMKCMFSGCSKLTSLNLNGLDTSAVTDMDSMFGSCGKLINLDLNGLNTSAVKSMGSMFSGCRSLTSVDLSGLDTSAVTSMGNMFNGCSNLTSVDLSGLDTGAVTAMEGMFRDCSSLTSVNLNGLDTSAVTSMERMFSGCNSLTGVDLSGLDTSAVTSMGYMFNGCSSLINMDLSGLDTSVVTSMYRMFEDCNKLISVNFSGCDLGAVKNVFGIFYKCSCLKSVDFSGCDMSAVTDTGLMFASCSSLTTLKTPNKIGKTAELPNQMRDSEGNVYTEMSSENVGKTLTRVQMAHTHSYGNGKVTKEATCSTEGEITYTCTICGETKTERIMKTEHIYDSGKETKKATCKTEGTKIYTCTVCKETKTVTISKLPHTYQEKLTKATLSKDGKITSTCKVCGAAGADKIISYPKTFTLSAKSFSYNGKAKKPTVTVTDAKGAKIAASNYKITYSGGRINVGSYKIAVAFKGNYSGTKSLSFTINPASIKIKSITPGSQKLTVKWEKNTKEVTGYELQYSTNKNFPKASAKTVTIKKNSTTSNVISKLKAKTKYFVRLRTYKTVSGKKYYSDWSKTGNAVTKK